KTNSYYCYICGHFGALMSSSNKKPQTDAFVNNGFQNWGKALDKSKGFDERLQSQGHILAASNFEVYQQREGTQQNVIQVLDKVELNKFVEIEN
ncbi:unnamed protein product, partial [Rotaria socialis]